MVLDPEPGSTWINTASEKRSSGFQPNSQEILVQHGYTTENALERVCTEHIWKYGIILYFVTCAAPDTVPRQDSKSYARAVFDHAACLSKSSSVQRKILFLIIIAGSYTDDIATQTFMSDYCTSCYDETNFEFFRLGLRIVRIAWFCDIRNEEVEKPGSVLHTLAGAMLC